MRNVFIEHPEIARRFSELKPALQRQSALVEANRCLNCFDAPCTIACPTHIDVPGFIKKISSGNVSGSARTILDANVLGGSCSHVCPVEVLCEGACVMNHSGRQPIQIALLQRYAMDDFYTHGGALPKRSQDEKPQRVACIGAGPASLACAAELRQRGYQVKILEQRHFPGGLNTYGVAEYKLRTVDSLREIDLIQRLGVEFRFGVQIGERELAAIENDYDAVFLGVGLGPMRKLGIPGEQYPGVIDALTFIERYKTAGQVSVGNSVVVIGAGNTAIDAAIAARRLGATDVSILYRRDELQMSAFSFEFEHAKQEGVQFYWNTLPVAIYRDPLTGMVGSIDCVTAGKAGHRTFQLPCDMVIPAIGQTPLLSFLEKCRGVQLEQGRIVVDRRTGQTNHPKFFAGGDCVNGGREVVDAVADGKRAGEAIAAALEAVYA